MSLDQGPQQVDVVMSSEPSSVSESAEQAKEPTEYEKLMAQFNELKIEPKTPQPKSWWRKPLINDKYLADLNKELLEIQREQRAAKDSAQWKAQIQDVELSLTDKFKIFLDLNQQTSLEQLDTKLGEYKKQYLTEQENALLIHPALKQSSNKELDKVADEKVVWKFKAAEEAKRPHQRNEKKILSTYEMLRTAAEQEELKASAAMRAKLNTVPENYKEKNSNPLRNRS